MHDRGLRMGGGSGRSHGGLLPDVALRLDRPAESEGSPLISVRGWSILLAVSGMLFAEATVVKAFLPGSHTNVIHFLLEGLFWYVAAKAIDALLWVMRRHPSRAAKAAPVRQPRLPFIVGLLFLQIYLIVAFVTRDDGAWYWLAIAFASFLLVRAAMERGWFVGRVVAR